MRPVMVMVFEEQLFGGITSEVVLATIVKSVAPITVSVSLKLWERPVKSVPVTVST